MMRSMFAGVSGLKAHQTRMDVIGNNIANVNTVGFKGSRVTFQDTLNQTLRLASGPQGGRGGINPAQVGLGVAISSIDVLQTQGNLQNTGKVTDLAIQGDGFFVVGDGTRQYYTRAGMFSLERDGQLVLPSNGLVVQGWMARDGAIDNTAQLTGVTLPVGQTIPPITTDNVEFKYNLDSRNNGSLSLGPNPQTILDGGNHSSRLTFTLEPTGNFNEFTYTATVADGTITDANGVAQTNSDGTPLTKITGRMIMNSDGTVQSITGNDFYIKSKEAGATAVQIGVPTVGEVANFAPVQKNILGTYTAAKPEGLAYTSMDLVDSNNNHIGVSYTLTPTGTPHQYTWTANVTGGSITSGSNTGTVTLDASGNVTAVTGGFGVTASTNPGAALTVNPPSVGGTNGGAFSAGSVNGGGTFTPATAATVSYPSTTISDGQGHTATVNYTLTATGTPNQFAWTASVSGGTPASASGTVTVNPSDGTITASTGGAFTVTPTGSTAGFQITPPSAGGTNQFGYQTTGVEVFKGTYTEPTDPAVTSRVIDSLGQAHTVYTTFTKTADNSWNWVAKDETGNTTYGSGSVTFDSTGKIASSVGGPIVINTSGADPISISPDFNSLTQYASETDIASASNGYPMGQLESFNIDSSGKIIGVFSNGLTQTLAQVAMASFRNPSGLTRAGDTMFSESNNSGTAQVGSAGTNGRGQITPGAIEMSNVDLSQEFTDMITTERGFQANSKIITTSDEMLQDLVNLKR